MRSVWQNTVTMSLKNSSHTNTPHRPHNRCVLMVVIVLSRKSPPMSCRYNAHRPTGTIYDSIMRRQVTTIRCTTTPPRLGSFAQISVNIVRQPRGGTCTTFTLTGSVGRHTDAATCAIYAIDKMIQNDTKYSSIVAAFALPLLPNILSFSYILHICYIELTYVYIS